MNLYMNEDIVNEIRKEVVVEMPKRWMWNCYPPTVAEVYCHHIDNIKHIAKWLETIRKSICLMDRCF